MASHLTYCQTADGTRLAVGSYPADSHGPVGLLLHGIASHMGWYRGLAELLQCRGVSMDLPDRRGIARSQGTPAHAASWRVLVEDAVQLALEIEQRHPRQPMHLMGISLGGAIALACAIAHPGLFRSLVLLSPALASAINLPLGRKLSVFSRALFAPTSLVDIPFGVDQLTTNLIWRKALSDDPRRTRQVSARFLLEVLRLQRYINRHVRYISEPVLALFGEKDEIIHNERSIAALGRIRSATVRVEVFEGVSHILAASLPRNRLADRVATWLNGDHGSASDRFTLLKTVLSHEGDEDQTPPNFAAEFDDESH